MKQKARDEPIKHTNEQNYTLIDTDNRMVGAIGVGGGRMKGAKGPSIGDKGDCTLGRERAAECTGAALYIRVMSLTDAAPINLILKNAQLLGVKPIIFGKWDYA